MKLVAIGAATVLLLGASIVGADSWFGNRKLPRAIDTPIVRKHVREDHKPGKKQRHPKQTVRLQVESSAALA